MRTTGFMGTVAIALAGIILWGGMIAPRPAAADNDLERALTGLAVGAIVYGMMGDDDDHRAEYHGGSRYVGRSRGFYNGNREAWERKQERSRHDWRPAPPARHRSAPPARHRPSTSYRHGWHNGYDRGFDDGYDWGYGDGYDDGYDRGRHTGRGGWGYW